MTLHCEVQFLYELHRLESNLYMILKSKYLCKSAQKNYKLRLPSQTNAEDTLLFEKSCTLRQNDANKEEFLQHYSK